MNQVIPSITKTAFNCPHCGTYAHQHWFSLYAEMMRNGKLPALMDGSVLNEAKSIPDQKQREKAVALCEKMITQRPVLSGSSFTADWTLHNVWLTKCFNCQEIAIWRSAIMVYPEPTTVCSANPDTPAHILADYEEAAAIVSKSAKGAAALLRLAIQKLCQHLGLPGKNINADIASLVKKGLDPRVQKAFDALRVFAVHPGTIDFRDDPKTAESLFKLFNLIVEKMISEPKHVDEVYALIPPDKLKAIEDRDAADKD
ncbi:UNVERIFIED_ORG: hypothetical protein GGE44_004259 [Rhizobium esperanzae]